MASDLLRRSRLPSACHGVHSPTKRAASCRSNTLSPPHVSFHESSFINTRPKICDVTVSCQENPRDNHTDRFSPRACEGAVLARRRNTLMFKVVTSIKLSCSYVVSLTLLPIHRPRDRFGQFRARGVAHDSCELWLTINLPANIPVGKYHTHISLSLSGQVESLTYYHHKPVVILFNPWSPDDASYLEDENVLKEYVLSDVGDICRGTVHKKELLKWEFGQFEDCCLDVALYLLRSLTADNCRSPTHVARAVVSQVTNRDKSGVITETCPGSYHGGTHPCRWNGSTVILQKYHRTRTPVRHGQCWVLAGICITLLRALGLASRPVTCYNAAHTCSKLGQVDKHFTTEGELLDNSTSDHIWVYHVWTEVWMTRADLVSGYDGWQVVDSTLQTRRSGQYGIGPVPVTAIKQRKVMVKKSCSHGGEFILSEVTADVRYLRVQSGAGNRPTSVAQVRHDETGLEIVTMATDENGSVCLLAITDKYRETSLSHVTDDSPSHITDHSSSHITDHSSLHISTFPSPTKDCTFALSTNEGACIGEPIHINITINNRGAMLRTVDGHVISHVIHYNGQIVRRFMSMQFSGVISPGLNHEASVNLPIEAKRYMSVLVEQCMVQFFVAIKVRESGQLFLKTYPFQLHLPTIEIDCPSRMVCGVTGRVKLKFKNILRCSLTHIVFLVQAGRLCPQREVSSRRTVMPGQTVCVELYLRATCPQGRYTLIASLHSNLITDVHGHTNIEVIENEISPEP